MQHFSTVNMIDATKNAVRDLLDGYRVQQFRYHRGLARALVDQQRTSTIKARMRLQKCHREAIMAYYAHLT